MSADVKKEGVTRRLKRKCIFGKEQYLLRQYLSRRPYRCFPYSGPQGVAFVCKGGSDEQAWRIGLHGTFNVRRIVLLDDKAVGVEVMLIGVLDGQQQC